MFVSLTLYWLSFEIVIPHTVRASFKAASPACKLYFLKGLDYLTCHEEHYFCENSCIVWLYFQKTEKIPVMMSSGWSPIGHITHFNIQPMGVEFKRHGTARQEGSNKIHHGVALCEACGPGFFGVWPMLRTKSQDIWPLLLHLQLYGSAILNCTAEDCSETYQDYFI